MGFAQVEVFEHISEGKLLIYSEERLKWLECHRN